MALVVLALSLPNGGGRAEEGRIVSPLSATPDEIARTLASYFPQVVTKVLHIEGNEVVLDAGTRNGFSRGMIIHLYRPGGPFAHPLTGRELGRYEKDLGKVEIVEASDTLSKGIRLGSTEDLHAGDGARFSSAGIPVALITMDDDTDKALTHDFRFALEETGRIRLLEPAEVARALADELSSKPPTLEMIRTAAPKLGSALGVEYFIVLENDPSGRGKTALLISTPRGTRVAALGPILSPEKAEGETSARVTANTPIPMQPTPVPSRAGGSGEKSLGPSGRGAVVLPLDFAGRFLRAADLDGDGRPEIILSDGNRIRIYHLDGNALQLVWEEKAFRKDQEHLWLDVGNIRGSGVPEVYVTNRWGGHLDSYIIAWNGGRFSRIIEHLPLYLRVMRIPGAGDRLFVQRSSLGEAFSGGVYTYEWRKDRYVRGGRVKLPAGQNVFGFTFIGPQFGGDVIAYAPDDHLVVHGPNGKRLYRSAETYGGLNLGFEQPNATSPLGDANRRVPVKGRIERLRDEVVTFRNVPLSGFFKGVPAYREGQLFGLSWSGSTLDRRWSFPQVDGFIADFTVAAVSGKGESDVVLLTRPAVAKTSVEWEDFQKMLQGHSEVLIYGLSEGTL